MTPFHERTSALNETGLWQHWSGHVVVTRYQASDKFEYFAVRNSLGIFDTSPLYKYRIAGSGTPSGSCPACWRATSAAARPGTPTTRPGSTSGVRPGGRRHPAPRTDEFLLTSAEPNFAWFADRVGRLAVTVEEVSLDIGTLAVQGRAHATCSRASCRR